MKVTVIPIAIGVLGTVPKYMIRELEELEIGGRAETIKAVVFMTSDRILRKVLETRGNCSHSDSSEKPSTNARVKKLPENKKKMLAQRYMVSSIGIMVRLFANGSGDLGSIPG